MNTIFTLLFLILLISFIVSLFRPEPFLLLFKNKLTKGGVKIALGLIIVFFLVAFGITSDYSEEDKKEEKVAGLQNEVEQLKEENEKLKGEEAGATEDSVVEPEEEEKEEKEEDGAKEDEDEDAEEKQNEEEEDIEEEAEEEQGEKEEEADEEIEERRSEEEAQETGEAEEDSQMQKVIKVIDGDTIKLENGGVVRYIGIDTPETVHPSKPVQCFGEEASKKNKELVEGKEVRLEKDISDTDKYDRLLRYVYIGDTFVNDYLVRNGYAHSSSYPPDVKYQDQFNQAEEEARENKRGLWADGACEEEEEAEEEEEEEEEEEIEEETAPPPAPASTSSCDCSGNTKNCSDFSTHDEAQACYESCLSSAGTDVHRLDRDKDGEACESLP